VAFSRSTTQARPAPVIGQQTDEVLRDFGITDGQIVDLRAEGVIL
jgi:crotonobetainyl-CoA:carnitine CoA-transferase CaiB-like acyl-CoA transferase